MHKIVVQLQTFGNQLHTFPHANVCVDTHKAKVQAFKIHIHHQEDKCREQWRNKQRKK